jgi:pheromone shutdown protein TraB
VQVYFQPPLVKDFQNVTENARKFPMWWKNKLLKVLSVFILDSLGSVLGTYVGLFEIVKNVFN